MACVVCQHCQGRLSKDEGVAMREGYSYHKKCHKCYVCSDTNLQNAEVFQGVIFCSSCSQRIFQGCYTARRNKNGKAKTCKTMHGTKRREKSILRARKGKHRHINGVLELTRLAASTESDSSDVTKLQKKISISPMSLNASKLSKNIERDSSKGSKDMKKNSAEIGMTTEVTQELLRQMNCPVVEGTKSPRSKSSPKDKGDNKYNKTVICSDLRIAELGASTEIAHMALRKKSEVPVIMKSDLKELGSVNTSALNQESDASGDGNEEWMESSYALTHRLRRNWLDRRLGSILKMPFDFFKRNILTRSSLISVRASDNGNRSLLNRLKILFHEEITEHQNRGMKRLYSTINRRRTPYKLGWLNLVAKVSSVLSPQIMVKHEKVHCPRCKHFKRSHSYRCMRSQVMRLAGPTKSKLTVLRSKIKKLLTPPILKGIVGCTNNHITTTHACGNDNHILTTQS